MDKFKLVSKFKPMGDQPEAIKTLSEGVLRGEKMQTLLGVTGSGKTFTMANIIEKVNRPTLILAHNKTLAAQLCEEFREFYRILSGEAQTLSYGEFIAPVFVLNAIERSLETGKEETVRRASI